MTTKTYAMTTTATTVQIPQVVYAYRNLGYTMHTIIAYLHAPSVGLRGNWIPPIRCRPLGRLPALVQSRTTESQFNRPE